MVSFGQSEKDALRKTSRFFLVIVLAVFLALSTACAANQPDANDLTPITVQLAWTHQAQFAGMYAADQNGYYAEEGLAVNFIEGGSGVNSVLGVTDGQAQFGIAGSDELILARSNDLPVKAIAVIFRRSPVVYISLAEKNIQKPEDMLGKTVRVTSNLAPSLHALMTKLGYRLDQFNEVNLPSDVALFASGDVPLWGAYANGFALTLERAGYQLNYIYPDDYGIHFYADTLYTTEALIEKDPDLVLRFLRATLKGWKWAIENPETAAPQALEYQPALDADYQVAQLKATFPLVFTGEDEIGWMKAEVWKQMYAVFSEQNLLGQSFNPDTLFTMQFLKALYGETP